MKNLFQIALIVFIISSCTGDDPDIPAVTPFTQASQLISPAYNASLKPGDSTLISLSILDAEKYKGSVIFYVDDQVIYSSSDKKEKYNAYWKSDLQSTGTHKIKTEIELDDGKKEVKTVDVLVLSDIIPSRENVRVIKTYPHDRSSYTQGLEFFENQLYEGTGMRGKSKLLLVDLPSGKATKEFSLPNNYFGEGITIMGDKIYQLTYQAKTGFVYDRLSFEKINEFTYTTKNNNEGWGLTHNDSLLIMSDGSHYLYFLDPDTFKEVKRIEVFSDKGALENLNELEYIDGEIYANIYTTNYILRINPENGKVLAIMDLSNLLDELDTQINIDVLNGIAYNNTFRKLYVTGKYWPNLFEIEPIRQ